MQFHSATGISQLMDTRPEILVVSRVKREATSACMTDNAEPLLEAATCHLQSFDCFVRLQCTAEELQSVLVDRSDKGPYEKLAPFSSNYHT